MQDRWGKGIQLISKVTRMMVTDWFCVGGKRSCFLDYYQSFSKQYAVGGMKEMILVTIAKIT